jgi:regulator of replication initiation timing
MQKKKKILQAEGMEVSAEMEFLSQQNIMLDLENKALKQRLESLNQEQLIKRCILFSFIFFLDLLF